MRILPFFSHSNHNTTHSRTIFHDFLSPPSGDLFLKSHHAFEIRVGIEIFPLFPLFKFKSQRHISRWLYCRFWKIVRYSLRTFSFFFRIFFSRAVPPFNKNKLQGNLFWDLQKFAKGRGLIKWVGMESKSASGRKKEKILFLYIVFFSNALLPS